MKKFFVLLLIVTLAAFVFVGCDLIPSEGEGEGEPEKPAVSVTVKGQVEIDGKVYVKGGKGKEITVTLSTPAKGSVLAYLSPCVGDYSKQYGYYNEVPVVLIPNADRTVWTGSGYFGCCNGNGSDDPCYLSCSDCCATIIRVVLAECDECWYDFPVIVDSEKPQIGPVEICIDNCVCEGCELTFKSKKFADPCGDCGAADVYCADCCSGFDKWTIALYNKYPFDKCCDTPCSEPIESGEGDCQIDWTSKCLGVPEWSPYEGTVWALITALDKVGNKVKYLVEIYYWYGDEGECEFEYYTWTKGEYNYEYSTSPCVDTPESDFTYCKA